MRDMANILEHLAQTVYSWNLSLALFYIVIIVVSLILVFRSKHRQKSSTVNSFRCSIDVEADIDRPIQLKVIDALYVLALVGR